MSSLYAYSVRSKSKVGLKTPEWAGQTNQPVLEVDNVIFKEQKDPSSWAETCRKLQNCDCKPNLYIYTDVHRCRSISYSTTKRRGQVNTLPLFQK